MPKIIYIEHDGTEHPVEVTTGWSLMEGAVKNDVPGIDAECGGACACATCHVYIDPAWTGKTGAPNEMEASMLDYTPGMTENSRLSCQIQITDEMDGLIARMPISQH